MAETEQAGKGGLAVQQRQSMGGNKPAKKNGAAYKAQKGKK